MSQAQGALAFDVSPADVSPADVSPAPTFRFDSHPVRIILRDGEPWFTAVDVCQAIHLDATAIRKLDNDEKGRIGVGNRRAHLLAAPYALESKLPHQPLDRIADRFDSFTLQLLPHLVRSIDLEVRVVDALDLVAQLGSRALLVPTAWAGSAR